MLSAPTKMGMVARVMSVTLTTVGIITAVIAWDAARYYISMAAWVWWLALNGGIFAFIWLISCNRTVRQIRDFNRKARELKPQPTTDAKEERDNSQLASPMYSQAPPALERTKSMVQRAKSAAQQQQQVEHRMATFVKFTYIATGLICFTCCLQLMDGYISFTRRNEVRNFKNDPAVWNPLGNIFPFCQLFAIICSLYYTYHHKQCELNDQAAQQQQQPTFGSPDGNVKSRHGKHEGTGDGAGTAAAGASFPTPPSQKKKHVVVAWSDTSRHASTSAAKSEQV